MDLFTISKSRKFFFSSIQQKKKKIPKPTPKPTPKPVKPDGPGPVIPPPVPPVPPKKPSWYFIGRCFRHQATWVAVLPDPSAARCKNFSKLPPKKKLGPSAWR